LKNFRNDIIIFGAEKIFVSVAENLPVKERFLLKNPQNYVIILIEDPNGLRLKEVMIK
jgi:hypothetical protein